MSRDGQVRREGWTRTYSCARVELLFVCIAGFRALPSPNQLILPEGIKIKGFCLQVVREILYLQGHTNPVPDPLESLSIGPGGAKRHCSVLKICVCGRDESVGAMLHHACRQALHEGLRRCVNVAEHGVSLPPSNQVDGAGVDLRQAERHGASCMEGSGADVDLGKADL